MNKYVHIGNYIHSIDMYTQHTFDLVNFSKNGIELTSYVVGLIFKKIPEKHKLFFYKTIEKTN